MSSSMAWPCTVLPGRRDHTTLFVEAEGMACRTGGWRTAKQQVAGQTGFAGHAAPSQHLANTTASDRLAFVLPLSSKK